MRNRALKQMRALLKKERECLISGRYDELAGLAQKKSLVLKKLSKAGSGNELAMVKREIQRNLELTGIALHAVTEFVGEQAERRMRSGQLQLYDKDGIRNVDCR